MTRVILLANTVAGPLRVRYCIKDITEPYSSLHMVASHRAGEITLYEELGVASTASPEEIREAFRALARILHPDQHTDPQLKKIAEAQMRKVNRAYAVLSNVEARHQYDESLHEDFLPPIAQDRALLAPTLKQQAGRVAWAVSILCAAGLIIWFAAENNPAQPNRTPEPVLPAQAAAAPTEPSTTPAADQASQIANLRSELRAMTVERDAAIHEISRLRKAENAQPPAVEPDTEIAESRLPASGTITEPTSPPRFSPPVASAPAPRPASATTPRIEKSSTSSGRKLSGFWFYTPPPHGLHNKEPLYPPEYIEATISEDNGTLYGKYRARFVIVDRAISPEVNFTFTGTATGGTQATLPWTGAGGAKGELTVKLVSENSLRIDWNATELGTRQGLNSGTAVLTRRIE